MLPIELVGWSSNTDFHVSPPSDDFHTPPDAVAAKYVSGSPGTPHDRLTRPPANGPTLRYFRAAYSGGPFGSGSAADRARGANAKTSANRGRRMGATHGGPRTGELRAMIPRGLPR